MPKTHRSRSRAPLPLNPRRKRLRRPSAYGAPEYYTRDRKPSVARPGPHSVSDEEN